MLCGHNHAEARRFDTYEGRTVLTLLSDFQSLPEGGGGYLRLLRFSPRQNLVRVQTYSPWLDRYDTDAGSQFEFGYRMDGPLGGLGVAPVGPAVVPGAVVAKPKP